MAGPYLPRTVLDEHNAVYPLTQRMSHTERNLLHRAIMAREVLPLIHNKVPESRFAVMGKNPPPEAQAKAGDPQVEVAGCPADPMPYLGAADVFVIP
jgi:hypothetical protein